MPKKINKLSKYEKTTKNIKALPAKKAMTRTREKIPKAMSQHEKIQTAESWMRMRKAELVIGRQAKRT